MASRRRAKTAGGARKTSQGVSQGAGRRVGQARVSVGPAGEGLDPADRLDKLEVFLQDFDREVSARKEQFQAVVSSVLQGIDTRYSMRVTSLPPHVRAMTLQEYRAMNLGDEQLEPPLEEFLEVDVVLDKVMRLQGKRAGGGKPSKRAIASDTGKGRVAGGEETAQERGNSHKNGTTRKLPARKAKSSSQATNLKEESSQKTDNDQLTGKLKKGFNNKSASSLGMPTVAFDPRLNRTPLVYRTRAGSKLLHGSLRLTGSPRSTAENSFERQISISQALIGLADKELDVVKMDGQMFEKMVKLKDKLAVLCLNPGSSQS